MVVWGVGVTGGPAPGLFCHITGFLRELLEGRWRGGTQEVALLRSRLNAMFRPLTPGFASHLPARTTPPREELGLRSSATGRGGSSGGTWGAGALRGPGAAPARGRQSRDRALPRPRVRWAGDYSGWRLCASLPRAPRGGRGAPAPAGSRPHLVSRPAAGARARREAPHAGAQSA